MTGGESEKASCCRRVDIIDADTGNLESGVPMKTERSFHSIAASSTNIVIFGGVNSMMENPLSACEIFDPDLQV